MAGKLEYGLNGSDHGLAYGYGTISEGWVRSRDMRY